MWGDGNFHLIILIERGNNIELEAAQQLSNAINILALKFGGTVTGEHGVGLGKKKYMQLEHGATYSLMWLLKSTINPRNLMNPDKLISLD